MGCFVLAHQHEWLARVTFVQPVNREPGDDVSTISFNPSFVAGRFEHRIVVLSLADQDVPIVEALWIALEVPFADHGCLVAGGLKQFRERLLVTVETITIATKSVEMTVFAGQNYGSTGAANGVSAEAVLKQHAFAGQLIDIRSWVEMSKPIAVGTDGVRRVIVGKEEDDIGTLVVLFGRIGRLVGAVGLSSGKSEKHSQEYDGKK